MGLIDEQKFDSLTPNCGTTVSQIQAGIHSLPACETTRRERRQPKAPYCISRNARSTPARPAPPQDVRSQNERCICRHDDGHNDGKDTEGRRKDLDHQNLDEELGLLRIRKGAPAAADPDAHAAHTTANDRQHHRATVQQSATGVARKEEGRGGYDGKAVAI